MNFYRVTFTLNGKQRSMAASSPKGKEDFQAMVDRQATRSPFFGYQGKVENIKVAAVEDQPAMPAATPATVREAAKLPAAAR